MERAAAYGPTTERPRLTVVTDGRATYSALPHAVLSDERTGHGHIVTYAVLQMHWWQGGECWASHATLATEAKCSLRQLQRYIKDLVRWGFISERHRGHGQAKAYAPKAAQHDTHVAFNTTPVSPLESNTTPVSEEHDTGVRFNTTPVSDRRRRTEEDSPKEEKQEVPDLPEPVVVVAADAAKPEAAKVSLSALSDSARLVLDDWRQKQGRKRPPKLNPAQAASLEEAIADLGTARLFEANTWAAESGVPELVKAIRAARTKRKRDEEDGIAPVAPSQPHTNGTASKLTPATDADRAIWATALTDLAGMMNAANFEQYIVPLDVAGRLEDGGLCLVVPAGVGATVARFRDGIRRALLDAGDPAPMAVAFKARRSTREPSHAE